MSIEPKDIPEPFRPPLPEVPYAPYCCTRTLRRSDVPGDFDAFVQAYLQAVCDLVVGDVDVTVQSDDVVEVTLCSYPEFPDE